MSVFSEECFSRHQHNQLASLLYWKLLMVSRLSEKALGKPQDNIQGNLNENNQGTHHADGDIVIQANTISYHDLSW